jgi:hypothetical protein
MLALLELEFIKVIVYVKSAPSGVELRTPLGKMSAADTGAFRTPIARTTPKNVNRFMLPPQFVFPPDGTEVALPHFPKTSHVSSELCTKPLAFCWMRVVPDARRISRHDPDTSLCGTSPKWRPVIGVVGQQPTRVDYLLPLVRLLHLVSGCDSIDGYSFFEFSVVFPRNGNSPSSSRLF